MYSGEPPFLAVKALCLHERFKVESSVCERPIGADRRSCVHALVERGAQRYPDSGYLPLNSSDLLQAGRFLLVECCCGPYTGEGEVV